MGPVDPCLAAHVNELNLSSGTREGAQENEKCEAGDGESGVWPNHILEGFRSRRRSSRIPEIPGHTGKDSLTDLRFQDALTRMGTSLSVCMRQLFADRNIAWKGMETKGPQSPECTPWVQNAEGPFGAHFLPGRYTLFPHFLWILLRGHKRGFHHRDAESQRRKFFSLSYFSNLGQHNQGGTDVRPCGVWEARQCAHPQDILYISSCRFPPGKEGERGMSWW